MDGVNAQDCYLQNRSDPRQPIPIQVLSHPLIGIRIYCCGVLDFRLERAFKSRGTKSLYRKSCSLIDNLGTLGRTEQNSFVWLTKTAIE